MYKLFFLGLFVLVTNVAFTQSGAGRVALVIGVSDYTHAQPLKNSLHDAQDMAAVLKGRGFRVIESYNAPTKREMQDAIRQYYAEIQGSGGTGLIFYSGHAMQVDGTNYLMPAQANPQLKADLDDQTVKLDFLMGVIEQASSTLSIVILDACRNNPFRGFSRSGEKGLNQVVAPRGSYVVYATAPGSVASDGVGRNGLFTASLLKHINTPGASLEQVFKATSRDVQTGSSGTQVPWINSSYTGDFYFMDANETVEVQAYEGLEFYEGDKLVGAVNIHYIFSQLPDSKQIDKEMQALSKKFKDSVDVMAANYQKALTDYQNNAANLTVGQAQAIEEDLISARQKYDAFTRDAVTTLEVRQQSLLQPVWDTIFAVGTGLDKQLGTKSKHNNNCTVKPDATLTKKMIDGFARMRGR